MKKVTLKKLSVENYKKFEAREFDFSGRTEVSGRNRQGKRREETIRRNNCWIDYNDWEQIEILIAVL